MQLQTAAKRQNQGLFLPMCTFAAVGAIAILLFCAVRTLFQDIYAPRRVLKRGRPPKIQSGFLTWISVVYRTEEKFLVSTIGLDAVMLLRFLKLGFQLFSILTVLCMGILAPINYYSNPPALDSINGFELESIILPALSVDNVPPQSSLLKVHLAFTWIISFIVIYCLIHYHRSFVNLKLQFEEYALRRTKMSKIEMRSVMVVSI